MNQEQMLVIGLGIIVFAIIYIALLLGMFIALIRMGEELEKQTKIQQKSHK